MDHQHATSKAYCVWSEDAYHHWYSLDHVNKKSLEVLLWTLGIDGSGAKECFSPNASGFLREDLITENYPLTADYLFAACVWDFGDLLEIRIRAGLNPTNGQVVDDSGKALFIATTFGNYTALRLLLEQGADVQWKDTGGVSALYQSVFARSLQICEVLLEKGAAPGTEDDHGGTPLCEAVYTRDLKMTRSF